MVNDNIKVITVLLLPILTILIAYMLGRSINPDVSLSGAEKWIIDYHTEIEKIPSSPPYRLTEKLKDPFEYVYVKITAPERFSEYHRASMSTKETLPKLTLTIIGKRKSFAILNGETVTPGSLFRGYRVEQILRDRVVLSKNGIRRTIFLEE